MTYQAVKSEDHGVKEALNEIELSFPRIYEELSSGMADGDTPGKRVDLKLLIDISRAISDWRSRIPKLKDPYSVHFYDGREWSTITNQMTKEDAYRTWYTLTKDASANYSSDFEQYYHIGPTFEKLCGRHPPSI